MRRIWNVVTGAALLAGSANAGATARSLSAGDLREAAASVAVGESVRIDGFAAGGQARSEVFVGERFEVFSPDARLVVVDEAGEHGHPLPANSYFRGSFEGIAGSLVLISVLEGGVVRGIATEPAGASLILPTGAAGTPEIRWVDRSAKARRFECDLRDLEAAERSPFGEGAAPTLALPEAPEGVPPTFTARVAVDTDFEFFQLFGSLPEAASYVADVVAYMSILYDAQVDTSISLGYVRLWSTAADPWTESSPRCNLFQFGKVWNDTQSTVTRTIAHLMSGKNNGGGVAWLGVLCNPGFNVTVQPTDGCSFSGTSNYGGAYGYTGTMDGDFVYENPSVLWDVVATTHEIGHNFNSPHTHCFNGLLGNANPIDACYAGECPGGCYCGATSLPGPGSLVGGAPGAGNGTIMSYCHLLSGGFGNISYTLGTAHPFGIAPGRVPIRMSGHVGAVAGSNPSCLAFVPGSSVVFRDGVDNGSTSNWSSVQP